jgi:cob(I)alamin adenosyltransferase
MSVLLSKIYTKSGDQGLTGLVGGQRVPKSDLRIECYGQVDELNAHVGLLVEHLMERKLDLNPENFEKAQSWLIAIQNELFDLGSVLATAPGDSYPGMSDFESPERCERLERQMDQMLENLPNLQSFVLPGGSMLNAQAHVCRTVTRRCERLNCLLEEREASRPGTVRYLNRLSDWFFVWSRWIQKELGQEEVLWVKDSVLLCKD